MILEMNPIPVKFCAKILGLMPSDVCRLPLTTASPSTKAILHKNLDELTFLEEKKTPRETSVEVSGYEDKGEPAHRVSKRHHIEPLPGAEYYTAFTEVHEERIIE